MRRAGRFAVCPVSRLFGFFALWCTAAGCGGSSGPSASATTAVQQYARALRANSARDAYDLLSAATRKALSYDEFAKEWTHSAAERTWQVSALEEGIRGNPDAGERARLSFDDGNVVYLRREGKAWRLETEIASRSRAKQPRDAIAMFANAIARRDIAAALDMLTRQRRDAIAKQVEGFISGLGNQIDDHLDHFGPDRAELRWDDNEFRYRVMLRKESDEWRIDDIFIRPGPPHDDGEAGTAPKATAPHGR